MTVPFLNCHAVIMAATSSPKRRHTAPSGIRMCRLELFLGLAVARQLMPFDGAVPPPARHRDRADGDLPGSVTGFALPLGHAGIIVGKSPAHNGGRRRD